MTKPGFKTKLREWYLLNFPNDTLAQEIDEDADFEGLFDTLDSYGNVYNYFGVGDSIIREHLFEGLAMCIGKDYDYVYHQWMMAVD